MNGEFGGAGDSNANVRNSNRHNRDEMKRHLEQSFTRNEEINILPGFKGSNWVATPTRRSVKMQSEASSVLPMQNGGGDTQSPQSQSYTSRAMRARKAAQKEYKTQLDLQIAQQNHLKELEAHKTTPHGSGTSGPTHPPGDVIPLEQNAYLPNWFTPNSQSAPQPLSGCVKSGEATADNITFTLFPPQASKSLPICQMSSTTTEPAMPYTSKFETAANDATRVLPPEHHHPISSFSSPQLQTSINNMDNELEISKNKQSIFPPICENESLEMSVSKSPIPSHHQSSPQFKSTPIPTPNAKNVFPPSNMARELPIGQYLSNSTNQTSPLTYFSRSLSNSPNFDSQCISGYFDEVLSPQAGSSPCGSSFGDNQSQSSVSFGSPSKFKPHVSQTADQRPQESALRSAYKSELTLQIQERRRQDEERLRQEQLQEERLQEKIKRDQEKMLKEYEEEQIRNKKKEEEKHERQLEILKREESIRKAEEEARQKVLEARRQQRQSIHSTNETSQEEAPSIYKPSLSPPIASLLSKLDSPISTNHSQARETKPRCAVPSPRHTSTATLTPQQDTPIGDRRSLGGRSSSAMTETLAFLKEVRHLLHGEMIEAQRLLEKQKAEYNS